MKPAILPLRGLRHAALLKSSTIRLSLIYMLLFGISVMILMAFIYWSTAAYMTQQMDYQIEADIKALVEHYELRGLGGLTNLLRKRISSKPVGTSLYLLTTDQFIPLLGNLDQWPLEKKDEHGWLNFRLENINENNEIHQARARTFYLPGNLFLLVGKDIHDLQKTKQLIIHTLISGLLITIVLAAAGGIMMSKSMLRRIESINSTSMEIMSGDLAKRIPAHHSNDDFDILASNLNAMLDRIQELMEGVRRVSDNIAHDLRTPLSRLKSHLDHLNSKQIEEDARQVLEQAIGEADGLLRTFNALLHIARIENSDLQENFTVLSLQEVLMDVVELYEPLSDEKEQILEINIETSVEIWGYRDLLVQAFANLLDNAIKYTPNQGSIRVAVELDDEIAVLSFTDSGIGIPAEARKKVFQRFFRLEESRNTSGNGLGLSLVYAVAKIHKFEIELLDNQPGLRVECQLPVHNEQAS